MAIINEFVLALYSYAQIQSIHSIFHPYSYLSVKIQINDRIFPDRFDTPVTRAKFNLYSVLEGPEDYSFYIINTTVIGATYCT
jgi:hypothetical protein